MIYTFQRRNVVVPFVAVLVGIAAASCSSDTRAILAPSDSQLSLTAAGPVVANQPVDVTVVASKSDGGPVADGTEIQLSASSGSFEPSKVRTQGGQAVATYSAGAAGPIELVAASDTVQGTLVVSAASAQPTQITITASADSVPSGGGELDVTATVVGGSGQPVTSAPVEFFATNGAFAPIGPLLTNTDGKVTARLSTPDATEVRARVLGVESSALSIGVQAPLGKGDDPNLPFRMTDVVWLNENVSEWEVTSEITEIRIDRSSVCIEHTKAGKWPVRGIGEGNPWVFGNVDGQWYASTYEYLRSGQICKHIERRGEWGIGPHTKKMPLLTWAPRQGELVGFMVSTFARDATRTSNERSNVKMVEWPY